MLFKDALEANGTVAVNTKATEKYTINAGKITIKSIFGDAAVACKTAKENLRL